MSDAIRELSSRSRLRIHLLGEGLLIGVVTGFVIAMYRLGIHKINEVMQSFLQRSDEPAVAISFVGMMLLMGVLAAYCLRCSPWISGSGIPQVSAQMAGKLTPKWQSVLPFKWLGGLLTLGGGLTLGREGPSVQIGAAIGQGFSELLHRPLIEKRYLITSGASAGLAAAFNAPISGAIFCLEELHRNFSSRALISAMISAFTAVFTAGLIFGTQPVLSFTDVSLLPLTQVHVAILLGVLTGLSGILFNKGVLFFKKRYDRMRPAWWVRGVVPFGIVAISCLLMPSLFGSGEPMIFYPAEPLVPVAILLLLYVVKSLLLMVCFGSGLPGGIFFPLLVLGSLAGQVFGGVLVELGVLEPQYVLIVSLMAMAGHFSSIVRAPLTGILLVTEMTGSFANMLSLGIVVLIAYLIAEAFHSEPIYESLQGLLPLPKEKVRGTHTDQHLIMEYGIEEFSPLDDATIASIQWPRDFLVVAIRRGDVEYTPTGSFQMKTGDYLICMFYNDDLAEVDAAMRLLISYHPSSS